MKNNKIYASIYLIIGIGIIGLWTMLLLTGQVPELETTPIAIRFHIVIEVLMALMSIFTAGLMYKQSVLYKQVMLLTNGMVFYSVVNSSGYYAENLNIPILVMFFVIVLYVIWTSYQVVCTRHVIER